MKWIKLLIVHCSLLIAAGAAHADTDTYRAQLGRCDNGETLAVLNTTNAVTDALMGASNCYVGVGMQVIREYYADTATDTGRKFIAFANAVHAASLNIYSGPDECYPECGTIAQTLRADTTESYIRQYVIDMLDYIDTLDI